MIKYKLTWARFFNEKKPSISKRWILKETAQTVWFWTFETWTGNRERYHKKKEMKESAGVKYYDTFDEARMHAIEHGSRMVETAEQNLKEAQTYYEAAKNFTEDQCLDKFTHDWTDEGAAEAKFIDGRENK
ncbi:MAG: hypothetical protein C0610_17145 [Desulfobacteraceae bacterium]|nr:MAG: hypothetical protein C0610_17145 [Desulfobacteraceae bacterium]